MRSPLRAVLVIGRAAAVCATVPTLILVTAATATATHTGANSTPELGPLITKLAQADQNLADLGGRIQQRQEDVNRALLEVSTRREAVAQATQEVAASRRSLDEAAAAIAAAQKRFDAFAVSAYMNGPSFSLVEAADPQEVITAASASRTLEVAFTQALTDLQRARTEQANRQSAARATQDKANAAAVDAQRSLDAATATLIAARGDFATQQDEVNTLVAQRNSVRTELARARGVAGEDHTSPPSPPPPAGAAADWDSAVTTGGWDTVVPAIPSANITGDPVAIINTVLQISATSAQLTADLGRKFLTQLGILSPSAAPADSGITNGRIPYVNGRQASEYVIRRAMSQIGVPYSWGGGTAAGPSRGIDSGAGTVGFDCSGLMLYAFAGVGIKLPHYSGSQYNAGRRIPTAQMRRGDLIFWGANASQHEAMYLGDGMMLEAQQTGVPVKVSPVRTSGMMPYATRLIDY